MRWGDWVPAEPANRAAFAAWRAGRLDAAAAGFTARLRDRPADAEAWRGLGSVQWTKGDFAAAKDCFSHALAAEPRNPMHWGNLGLALRDLGDKPAAIAAFAVATGLDHLYEPAWNEWANVLVETGRALEALPLYDRAISLEPTRGVLHHNRGVCLLRLGETEAARASFLQALKHEPCYRHTLNELARLDGALRPAAE
jgi:tetratricopeptide (TPR) repeat protein